MPINILKIGDYKIYQYWKKGIFKKYFWTSLVAQMVKNLPEMRKTQVWILVGKILGRREPLPTPVFLPGESHGQRSLWATVHSVAQSWTWLKRLRMHNEWTKLSQEAVMSSSLEVFWTERLSTCEQNCKRIQPLVGFDDPTSTSLPALKIFIYFLWFLAAPHGIWDHSSPTRDQACAACSGSTES